MVNRRITARAESSGVLNGTRLHFELEPGTVGRLSTNPRHADEDNHWFAPV